jgi:choline-sulfatase
MVKDKFARAGVRLNGAVNILLVMADQLNPRALPAYGNQVVKAPNITRLAEEGVVFEHGYCSSPLCAPSRASMLSGRLPSRIGVYDNGAEFPASIPTFAHHLRAGGYRTLLAGKMHFIGPDQLHGFEERLTPDIYPAGLHWIPDWEAPPGERLPWYHDMSSVFEAGVAQATLQLDFDEEVSFRSVRAIYDLARTGDDRPFLLVASFSQPHDPWEVQQEYWDRYEGATIDMPEVPAIADDELDPHSRRIRGMCGGIGLNVPEAIMLNARRAHYAAISYVDDQVGKLLEALDTVGLRQDTVVIFASDHGEMLGERGLWYKMSFFEPSATVPLIVSAPGRFAPRRVEHNVSLLDVAPTLAELAGVAEAASMADPDGTSLVPHLDGRHATNGDAVVGEYHAEGALEPMVMIRRGPMKFISAPGDPDQLYDVANDPHELANLAVSPSHAREVAAFRGEVAARWDLARLRDEVVSSQRRRRGIAQALSMGTQHEWDYAPPDESSGRFVRGSDFWTPFERARIRRGGGAQPGSKT